MKLSMTNATPQPRIRQHCPTEPGRPGDRFANASLWPDSFTGDPAAVRALGPDRPSDRFANATLWPDSFTGDPAAVRSLGLVETLVAGRPRPTRPDTDLEPVPMKGKKKGGFWSGLWDAIKKAINKGIETIIGSVITWGTGKIFGPTKPSPTFPK